jgi:hypothetical protein
MHFRTRNNVIQVIRTTYDPVTQKGKNEIVGRINKLNPTLADDLRAALDPGEIKEAETWLAGRLRMTTLQNELTARSLPEAILKTAEWLALAENHDDARLLFAEMLSAWQKLRRAAKQQGIIEP